MSSDCYDCPDCGAKHGFYDDCISEPYTEIHFKCSCGGLRYVEYPEESGDSLEYRCMCGQYYKKVIRIPDEDIISYRNFRKPRVTAPEEERRG